jgi:hypothetical protein
LAVDDGFPKPVIELLVHRGLRAGIERD